MNATRVPFLLLLAMTMLAMTGCAQRDVGSSIRSDAQGRPALVNPSPVTLTIEDDVKKGVANGPGPARFTSITADEVQTFQSGTTPRDMYVALPNGAKINLSSGTDIVAEGLEFDPAAGSFKVAKFATTASESLRAGNEAYDRLVTYWAARDQASKEAILAELKTLEASANVAGGVLAGLIKALTTGVP